MSHGSDGLVKMQFQVFKFSMLVVAFVIPSKYGALANKKAADPASSSILSRCPRSKYLVRTLTFDQSCWSFYMYDHALSQLTIELVTTV